MHGTTERRGRHGRARRKLQHRHARELVSVGGVVEPQRKGASHSAKELLKPLQQLVGPSVDVALLQSLVRVMDADGSGCVDFDEWDSIFTGTEAGSVTKKMKLTRRPHNKQKHACQLPMFRMMVQYDDINMHNARQSLVHNPLSSYGFTYQCTYLDRVLTALHDITRPSMRPSTSRYPSRGCFMSKRRSMLPITS